MRESIDPAELALLGARFLNGAKIAAEAKTKMGAQQALSQVANLLDQVPGEEKLTRLLRQSSSTAADLDTEQLLDLCRQAANQCLQISQTLGATSSQRIEANKIAAEGAAAAKRPRKEKRQKTSSRPMRVSRCRYWMCSRCQGVFEKEDLELKIKMYESPREVMIRGTRECANCHAVYQVRDIYSGNHDVPRRHWSQLPGPAELEEESPANEPESKPWVSTADWEFIRTESLRWLALIGLPAAGFLIFWLAWTWHQGAGRVPGTGTTLILAALIGACVSALGFSLFVRHSDRHVGPSKSEFRRRFTVLAAGLAVALVGAFGVSYSIEDFALRWAVRSGGAVVVIFLAVILMDLYERRRLGSSYGRWKVEGASMVKDSKLLAALIVLTFVGTFASDLFEDVAIRWLTRVGLWLLTGGVAILLIGRLRR